MRNNIGTILQIFDRHISQKKLISIIYAACQQCDVCPQRIVLDETLLIAEVKLIHVSIGTLLHIEKCELINRYSVSCKLTHRYCEIINLINDLPLKAV